MRGAAVLLLALTALACGGRPETRHATTRATAPCAATPRAADLRIAALPHTPPVLVHVPAGLRAGQRVPLVLGLHGAGQDGRGFEGESNFTQADNERSGLRLLRAAITGVARVACVDRGRVLVTGISSGGRMTYAAGCELAD